MLTKSTKDREASADRLQSLVTRWHDLAWTQRAKASEGRVGWAEHLKRVADEQATAEAEPKG